MDSFSVELKFFYKMEKKINEFDLAVQSDLIYSSVKYFCCVTLTEHWRCHDDQMGVWVVSPVLMVLETLWVLHIYKNGGSQ